MGQFWAGRWRNKSISIIFYSNRNKKGPQWPDCFLSPCWLQLLQQESACPCLSPGTHLHAGFCLHTPCWLFRDYVEACAKELPSWAFCPTAHTQLVAPWSSLSRCHRAGDAEGTQPFATGPHGGVADVTLVAEGHSWGSFAVPSSQLSRSMTVHDNPLLSSSRKSSTMPQCATAKSEVRWQLHQKGTSVKLMGKSNPAKWPNPGSFCRLCFPAWTFSTWMIQQTTRQKSNSLSVW